MRKKTKRILLIILGALAAFAYFALVPYRSQTEEVLREAGLLGEVQEPDYSHVTDELDARYADAPSYSGFYVLHDNKYYSVGYPNWFDDTSFESELYTDQVESLSVQGHRVAFLNEYDTVIPTLYLEKGDKFLYYSPTNVLDCYTFAKYEDLGYSLPITNYEATTAGYVFLPIAREAETENAGILLPSLMKDTFLGLPLFKEEESFASFRIYTVNDAAISTDYISDGILKGLKRNGQYQINGAFGSEDFQCSATAQYHFFKETELYAEAEYVSNYNGVYEIKIPDYLTSGYYMMSDGAFFRLIVEGDSYDMYNQNPDQFNRRQLNLDTQWALENGGSIEASHVLDSEGHIVSDSGKAYSSNPDLNFYTTGVPGALGFVSEEEPEAALAQEETDPENENIGNLETVYYRLQLKDGVEKVTLPQNQPLYELYSDAAKSPCMIRQCINDTVETLDYKKTEDPVGDVSQAFLYQSTFSQDKTFSAGATIYIEVGLYQGAKVGFLSKAEEFELTPVEDEAELPAALTSTESLPGKRH